MSKNAFKITCCPSTAILQINQVQAREAISALYQYKIDVLASQPLGDLTNKPFGFAVELDGRVVRYVHGIITQMDNYQVTVRPRIFLLSQQFKNRIFYQKDARSITSEIFDDCRQIQCVWKLSKSAKKYEYKVQYNESSLNFLLRLLNDAGILFYFIYQSGSHQIVFTDNLHNLPACNLNDSQFESKHLIIKGQQRKTNVETTHLELMAGYRDKTHVIKKSRWHIRAPLKIQSLLQLWEAKTKSDFLPTSFEPNFIGEQSATVIGLSQNSTYANEQTSIKIQFIWQQKKQSMWVALSHYWAGKDHGVQFIPQVGDRVRVGFMQGNPDSPIVLGVIKDQPDKKIFGISSEKHHLIFDHEVSPPEINVGSQGSQQLEIDGSLTKNIEQGLETVIEGDQSIQILKQGMNIEAKSIQFTVGKSQLCIDSAGIHLKSPSIQLKTGGSAAPLARKDDLQTCPENYSGVTPHEGGPILGGSSNVSINAKPVARVDDMVQCAQSKNKITSGIASILVNNKPVAHVGSKTQDGGEVIKGASGVTGG